MTYTSNGQTIQSQPIITSQRPLIALQTSNSMRYSKIESFIIKILLNDEAVLNDYVTSIQRHFIELLRSFGFNDYQLKGRFDSYLEEDK